MTIARRHIFFALFSCALFIAMSGPLLALVKFASDTEHTHASQIFLIPLISAALIFMNRQRVFEQVRHSAWAAGISALIGIGLLVAGNAWGAQLIPSDQLAFYSSSLLAFWFAGFLFFYGAAAFKAALFPLLFLSLCIPIPAAALDQTVAFLQYRSADMTYGLLKISGTPVYREGVVFTLPNLVIEVAPECSGIRSAISIFILTLLAGYLMLRTSSRRAIFIAVAIPIIIFKNAVRIATLSLLAIHVDPQILVSRLHREGGIPFFILGLVLIYPVLMLLIKSEKAARPRTERLPAFASLTREADL